MKRIIFIIFVFFTLSLSCKDATIKGPKDPAEPVIKVQEDESSSATSSEAENIDYNIEFQNQKGVFGKGVIKELKGFYLKLTWPGNEDGSQELLIDFVKSIRIKGYSPIKKNKDNLNLSLVYYMPQMYDIELKDGKSIKGARGRIEELDSFVVFNATGRLKCYTYFGRYWLEDKKMFNDNKSTNFNESPKVPDSVIIYIEFKDAKK
jgi:hypothetical protein